MILIFKIKQFKLRLSSWFKSAQPCKLKSHASFILSLSEIWTFFRTSLPYGY